MDDHEALGSIPGRRVLCSLNALRTVRHFHSLWVLRFQESIRLYQRMEEMPVRRGRRGTAQLTLTCRRSETWGCKRCRLLSLRGFHDLEQNGFNVASTFTLVRVEKVAEKFWSYTDRSFWKCWCSFSGHWMESVTSHLLSPQENVYVFLCKRPSKECFVPCHMPLPRQASKQETIHTRIPLFLSFIFQTGQ